MHCLAKALDLKREDVSFGKNEAVGDASCSQTTLLGETVDVGARDTEKHCGFTAAEESRGRVHDAIVPETVNQKKLQIYNLPRTVGSVTHFEPMLSFDQSDRHSLYLALHERVISEFFEFRDSGGTKLSDLLSNVLCGLEEAYRAEMIFSEAGELGTLKTDFSPATC